MKLRSILVLALTLICAPAYAQVSPGTSPLSIAKGGTNGATVPSAQANLGIRGQLTGNITYYVNGNAGATAVCGVTGTLTCQPGSNSNNGLSNAAPFLTAQQAVNTILNSIDAAGKSVTINLAHNAGTTNYAFSCNNGAFIGGITVNLVGDYTAPTTVVMLAPNGTYGIFSGDGCSISASAFAVADQGTAAGAFFARNGAIPGGVDVRSITYQGTWNSGSAINVSVGAGSIINMLGADSNSPSFPNTISSSASIGQAFQVQNGGRIAFLNQTIAVPTAFTTTGFAVNLGGYMDGLTNGMFTGAGAPGVTGSRCQAVNAYFGGVDPNTVFVGNVTCGSQIFTKVTGALKSDSSGNLTQAAMVDISDYTATTWTPTLVGSTSGSWTLSTAVGSYEKIGRQINARFTIVASASSAPVGNVQIGGLPVASANVTNDNGICFIGLLGGWTSAGGYTIPAGLVTPNTSVVSMSEAGSGLAGRFMPVGSLSATPTIEGTCVYHN